MDMLELARQLFTYDRETGVLRWKVNHNSNARAGQLAGTLDSHGHIRVSVNNKTYAAHRLIWLLAYGEMPQSPMELDHINRIKTDNRLENLRIVSRSENMRNRPLLRNNTSGVSGVAFHKATQKWMAKIPLGDGRSKHLGVFPTKEEAIAARINAEKESGGFCEKL